MIGLNQAGVSGFVAGTTAPEQMNARPIPNAHRRVFRQALSRTALFLSLLASAPLSAAEFPEPYNTERDPSQPMPAAEAAEKLQLPPGFKATAFAAEPEVQNPIALAWDTRGRLWVAENYTYAESGRKFDLRLRDRILIFEDRDGDGRFDSRKVFADDLQMLTSLEVGYGGVWVMCPPQLRFIPDRNGDGVPDGAPEVVLDGLTGSPDMHHTFANGLRFGPDGWLYGRCGVASQGEMGAPGTPAAMRVPLRGAIWRYHPTRKVVEALSSGTTNPWGHDWNQHGELFFINTVTGHLWHNFAGAHFARLSEVNRNPRDYEFINQHADHWHFDTHKQWQDSRDGKANAFGGGHAHVGVMIYQGDNWPAEYRGRLFTLNLHGRRANQEVLERQGSGYVGRHAPDFFAAADPWFRGQELSCGPDGGVFVLDWSDTGECHEYTGVHRTSGRIFKITFGQPVRPAISDVARLSGSELVKLHLHPNDWFTRQARLELAGRQAAGRGLDDAREQLLKLFATQADSVMKLRALWSLYGIGAADEPFLREALGQPDEHVRTWAIRLLTDRWPLDTVLSRRPGAAPLASSESLLSRFVQLAQAEESGLVRLALASTLQRLPLAQRPPLAAALLSRAVDANDHNLPLLIWYGLIPLADENPGSLVALAAGAKMPQVRRFIARRLCEDIEKNPAPLNDLLQIAATQAEAFQMDVLTGAGEALAGWHKATKPAAWDDLARQLQNSPAPALRDRVRDLAVVFGDGRALEMVRQVALDPTADLNARKAALQSLIDNRAPELQPVCEKLLNEPFLNAVAARGLASLDAASIGEKLIKAYRRFDPADRGQLISALVSRTVWARALVDAVEQGKIPRTDISPFHARQIRGLGDTELNGRLAKVWGEIRDPGTDKQQLVAKWKAALTPAALTNASPGQGREVFNVTCAPCHTLYGEGGKVGPDLTGSGRGDLDYLLENLLDPSAIVAADFRMSVLDLKDGRVLNGILTAQTERTVTLKTMTEVLALERKDIVGMKESSVSMMPEGLLEALTEEQARDLVAYLMRP
jgi:putative membrane-bound dehydrogenase-like protein